ncbi:unnamed protein product [Larinioides sclopetarius]|uniref:Uncharacterized protein n=1 Tax=Larinioides sclopetarius TaxID=280406 RepID=A0AAV1YPK3_9ARAC
MIKSVPCRKGTTHGTTKLWNAHRYCRPGDQDKTGFYHVTRRLYQFFLATFPMLLYGNRS